MTVLITERLVLRPFEVGDAPAIVDALNDMEMCRGLTVVPCPYSRADADWFINEGSAQALAVCLNDNTLVGAMGLGKTLGYWIAKPYWGKGFATEAATPVLDAHFGTGDDPVHSGYVDDNYGSAKVLKKLGFTVTGDTLLPIRSRGIDAPAKTVVLTKAAWEARA